MSGNVDDVALFKKREKVFPKRVWGRYRKIKWLVMLFTLSVYYLTPFLRFDRGPNVPDQAILIDMTNSRAYFFFIEIWPQEVYYLTGILIFLAVALFFVTSLFGRVWCGYMCPQTVWTDLFVWVERIVQGDRVQRMRLRSAPLSLNKVWKLLLTHSIWLVIGLFTGGAWVFYFNDAPTLLEGLLHLDVSSSVLGWMIALTLSTYLFAGYAREQVCTYVCPYSRFQSAMFDKDSLVIGYDAARGEARGKHKKGTSFEGRGHCIDCTACVQVCPMGIDIRDGLQMECIACGLCVDACNDIMEKVDLPQGLIRYDTEAGLAGEAATQKPRFLRPRTIWYSMILIIVGGLMLYGLLDRKSLELHVLHDRNPLYVTLSDGTLRNGYDIKILNKTHQDVTYKLHIEGLGAYEVKVQGANGASAEALPVYADSVGHFRLYVMSESKDQARTPVVFVLEENGSNLQDSYDSVFVSKDHDH